MRAELLDPTKRMEACRADDPVLLRRPAGLLTADEIEFVEPDDWSLDDFETASARTRLQGRHYLNGRGWMKRRRSPVGPRREDRR
jgi:hypothetical protein